MCAAPFVFLVAAVILCLSPLAIPFIPVLLCYWYREKRAGRELNFRSWFGNPADLEPEVEASTLAKPASSPRNPETLEADLDTAELLQAR